MKAFVTGASGFIGANLVRLLLARGHQVRALVRSNSSLNNLQGLPIEIVTGNLLDLDLEQKMQSCDVLFHVAALYSLWHKDRDLLYQNNVLGTRNVLQAARKANLERAVYTSSVAAIGTSKQKGELVNENHQSPPEELIGDYKKSKYWAEQEALEAIKNGQDIVIVNPSTPIGPWDLKPTPTGEIICRFLAKKMPAYVDTGLNFIDVRDVAWGHLLALEKGKTGERYILGNQNLSLKEFLEILAGLTQQSSPKLQVPLWLPLSVAWLDEYVLPFLGKTPSIPFAGVQMSAQSMYYDPGKAQKELGLPSSCLKQAITDAVDWFGDHSFD